MEAIATGSCLQRAEFLEGQIKGRTLRLGRSIDFASLFRLPAMCGLGAQCALYRQHIAR